MITSIGIYGDSFGTYSLSGEPLFRQKGMSHHWSTLLKEQFKCKLVNYALSGSSVYYSYKKFLETYQLHDLVIFLVTDPFRFIKPLDFSFSKNACITNQLQIDVWRKTKNNSTEDDRLLLDKLENWFELTDQGYQYDISELLVDRVKSMHNNIVIIPCYEISFREEYRNSNNFIREVNLCSLYYKQMDELNFSDTGMNINWVENCEFIAGHLTPEYNKIAYENISFYIKNKYWDWKMPQKPIIDKDNRYRYYNKI